MKGRKLLVTLGLCVAAATASVTVATPAFAWDEWMYTDDAAPGGKVSFTRDGNVVELCDIEADGYAVGLLVMDRTANKVKYTYTIGGEGRCQTFRASLGGRYDLAEDHDFLFEICLVRGGKGYYCDEAIWSNEAPH